VSSHAPAPDPRVLHWTRGARIAVVGGYGLLGSALLARLAACGASVVVVEPRPPVRPNPAADHRTGDVLDLESLRKGFAGCSAVFHLAALKVARDSADNPLEYFSVNAQGTAHVAEACRNSGVRHLTYASTSHVYGIPAVDLVPETHPTRPRSVYAASKLAGESIALAYQAAYGMDVRVARMANLYGGRADAATIVGRAVSQAVAGESIRLRNLDSVRDFLHVDDAAEGLLRIAAAGGSASPQSRILNLSDGKGVSTGRIAELVASAAEAIGLPRPDIRKPEKTEPEEVPRLVLSPGLLQSVTGWIPSTDLSWGLDALLRSTLEGKQKAP